MSPSTQAAKVTVPIPRKADTISVCPDCLRSKGKSIPLIWTFAFNGAEYFCIECGGAFGCFEAASIEGTPGLERLAKEYEDHHKPKLSAVTWRVCWLKRCKKCKGGTPGNYHAKHLTKKEQKQLEEAQLWLDGIRKRNKR